MKKRYLLLLALLIIALLAYSQRATLAKRIMAIGVERAMSSDTLAAFGEGLHIVLCGAGGPLADIKRSGACVAVMAGDSLYIVDAGTNGLRNLMRMRLPVGNVRAVFLTHFHSDHIDGLGELATIRWVNGSHTTPLPVYGGAGISNIVDGFNLAYKLDGGYRTAHHGEEFVPASGHGMAAKQFAAPATGNAAIIYARDGLVVKALTVDHAPVSPAVAYLFEYQGRTVLISGDTKKSANIEKFSAGIDLLVHEALSHELVGIMNQAAKNAGNALMEKISFDIPDYHASPVQVAETARAAKVGHLLYYHVVPPLIFPGMEAAWTKGVDEVFANYTVGKDGTSFTLPPNSKKIIDNKSSL